ncbi:hypothetical protein J6590_010768 [Homalodisca vitripennis]|nr:hypothetical protein J6590_010768 [Homalodisca vitripennis]
MGVWNSSSLCSEVCLFSLRSPPHRRLSGCRLSVVIPDRRLRTSRYFRRKTPYGSMEQFIMCSTSSWNECSPAMLFSEFVEYDESVQKRKE